MVHIRQSRTDSVLDCLGFQANDLEMLQMIPFSLECGRFGFTDYSKVDVSGCVVQTRQFWRGKASGSGQFKVLVPGFMVQSVHRPNGVFRTQSKSYRPVIVTFSRRFFQELCPSDGRSRHTV